MRIKLLTLLVAVIVAGAIAVTLSRSRDRSTRAPSRAVASATTPRLTIANYAFAPKVLSVGSGTTITVTNTDSTAHTATEGSGAFDSGTLKPGQSARFTLKKPGIYTYICQFHAFMTGTIKVVG